MNLRNYNQMTDSVNDADLVLIGLGEEWILSQEDIIADLKIKNKKLYALMEKVYTTDKFSTILPVLEHYYYLHYIPDNLEQAYQNLKNLLKDKNYFIVTLSTDTYLSRMNFKDDRYVMPCGNIELMQCNKRCNHEFIDSAVYLKDIGSEINDFLTNNDYISQNMCEDFLYDLSIKYNNQKCKVCSSEMVFNTLDADIYCEEGYLEYWKTYMKWLQGTVNKKLCIIEAGVGLKLPSVIRFPFEKTAFFNQKATMFRIHHKFYQVPENITERAYGANQNSVLLFSKEQVEADL